MQIPSTARRLVLIGLLTIASVLPGCTLAGNPWAANYVANPAVLEGPELREDLPPTVVEVFDLERPRLIAYREGLAERRAASDLPIERWDRQQYLDEVQALLDALRAPVPADRVILLGVSEFTTDERTATRPAGISALAREIGADYAVASSRFIGRQERVTREAITSSFSVDRVVPERVKKDGEIEYTRQREYGSETTYVPVVVELATFHHVAYFLREARPGEAPDAGFVLLTRPLMTGR